MASIYHALLRRIRADGFGVYEKEYRLGKMEKLGRVVGQLLRTV
jgi:hypothetical protein